MYNLLLGNIYRYNQHVIDYMKVFFNERKKKAVLDSVG